jgi:septum formation protein
MNEPLPLVILASASPRRSQLLTQIGVAHRILPVDANETPHAGETPEDYVLRVAAEKSRHGRECSGGGLPVLAADTAVVLDGGILGKPRDATDALEMLRRLSGREHRVLSAVALCCPANGKQTALSISRVCFRELGEGEIRAYWRTGEPCGKAGAYAIQGLAAVFIERLEGSYSGVMGLPLFETAQLLRQAGIYSLSKAP